MGFDLKIIIFDKFQESSYQDYYSISSGEIRKLNDLLFNGYTSQMLLIMPSE